MDVVYTKSAQKVLKKMQPKKAAEILNKMEDIAEDPYRPDNMISPLKGVENGYRRRFGDWRVLYTIDETIEILEVFKIGARGDVYQ